MASVAVKTALPDCCCALSEAARDRQIATNKHIVAISVRQCRVKAAGLLTPAATCSMSVRLRYLRIHSPSKQAGSGPLPNLLSIAVTQLEPKAPARPASKQAGSGPLPNLLSIAVTQLEPKAPARPGSLPTQLDPGHGSTTQTRRDYGS